MYRLGLADRKSGHLTPLLQDIARKHSNGEPSRPTPSNRPLAKARAFLGSPFQ
jgi:hypothetical protein